MGRFALFLLAAALAFAAPIASSSGAHARGHRCVAKTMSGSKLSGAVEQVTNAALTGSPIKAHASKPLTSVFNPLFGEQSGPARRDPGGPLAFQRPLVLVK